MHFSDSVTSETISFCLRLATLNCICKNDAIQWILINVIYRICSTDFILFISTIEMFREAMV